MKRGTMLAALLIGAFIAYLNENLLANTFPGLMREFNVAASTIQWCIDRLYADDRHTGAGDRIATAMVHDSTDVLSAMVLFLAGTCLCAVSPGFEILLMGRIVQACGTGLLLLLIWRQLKIKEPLIDLSVFRYPAFSLVAVLIVVLMMVLFATTTLLPIYMQDVMQLTAFATGLLLMPGAMGSGIAAHPERCRREYVRTEQADHPR